MDNRQVIRDILDTIEDNDIDSFINLLNTHPDYLYEMTPFGTWLHFASSEGRLDMVKELVKRGFDVNVRGGTFDGGAINEAAAEGHYDVVKYLLSCGAMLDISEPEKNPLFGAIMSGSKDIVKLLIENGIDTSVKYTGENMNNMDACAFAIERGQLEIAEILKNTIR